MIEELEAYFDEINWKGDMRTLATLIESHKRRGEVVKDQIKFINKRLEESFKLEEEVFLSQFNNKYIEIDKLKTLTIEQIGELW